MLVTMECLWKSSAMAMSRIFQQNMFDIPHDEYQAYTCQL